MLNHSGLSTVTGFQNISDITHLSIGVLTTMYSNYYSKFLFTTALTGLLFLLTTSASAQSVQVGKGSYSTTLPANEKGASLADGQEAFPKITDNFDKPIATNDFWSSLIYPYRGNQFSSNLFAYPLTFRALENGLGLSYSSTHTYFDTTNDYWFFSEGQLTVGMVGLNATESLTEDYGDWTVSTLWESDTLSFRATIGHGLPYSFYTISGGNAQISLVDVPSIWHNENEVIGLTIDGSHYGIFAPTGSSWSGTQILESDLNGLDYLSVAILPDSSEATLEFYREHAYAFVTNSSVEWEYDEETALLTSTLTYETELKDADPSNVNETLTALLPHQWKNSDASLTSHTYNSQRGLMKVFEGNSFTTTSLFSGVLPTLPDLGDYNRIELLDFVKDVAEETLPINNTYDSGKEMGRFARVIHIAEQLGALAERDYLLAELKIRMEDWLTVGGALEYNYNSTWNSLTGYPSAHGADLQLNDQHFHAGYAIMAAATIAQYDSAWASQENWGGMVNLLIKNAANWDRTDTQFPFLRNHDIYAGHSWAAGHGDFDPGNNQESSSESMQFASAAVLWGEITNQDDIRDVGIFLYTTETEAIEQYWFDVDDEVFPEDYTKTAIGIVWGGGAVYNTWFSGAPEFIHGINFLPFTGGSLYLGRDPDYVLDNYNAVVTELGSQPTVWKDVFWQYLSLSDADLALSYYEADPNYTPFDGESRAHTLHWLHNMKAMGQVDTDVYADIASYSVFVDSNDDTTYVAYNADNTDRIVSFTNGFSFTVPAKSMATHQTGAMENPIGVPDSPIINPEFVISIFSDSYSSALDAKFDVDEDQSTITDLEIINGNNVLKYENLDFQTTEFEFPISVFSRTNIHVDFYSADTTTISVYLISEDSEEKSVEFATDSSAWHNVVIPLSSFSDVVDLNAISAIRIEGEGTIYVDNIFFSGDTPVPTGPSTVSDTPELDAENVISIFSNAYDNLEGVNYTPDWLQNTITSIIQIADNDILLYENLDYQGTEFGSNVDVSAMEWFHLDYWTENSTNLNVYLISPGPIEQEFNIAIKQNSWESIDIPLSEFEDVNLNEVFQLKITGDGTLYLDNFYFGKNPDLTEAPTPTHDANKVVSLFSDTYDDITVDTWSAPWDQAALEDIAINENNMKHYSNVNFAGIEFIANQVDATNLTHFRFDFLTQQATSSPAEFSLKLVDFGANGFWDGGATDDVEHELFFDAESTPALESNKWISFDIPIDAFENMVTREHLSQLLFLGGGGMNEFYIDNVYFYGDAIINSNDDENSDIPTELKLSQNYPNPFNPSTNIEFSLPSASQVSLIIYNSLGQQVSKLLDTQLSPGAHSITWNAKWAPSGVYFYQLKTANATLTKRMLLIK